MQFRRSSIVTNIATRALVGNARNVLVSDLAGRSNIVLKARELGFNLVNDTPELKEILARIKELEHQGYEFEGRRGIAGGAHSRHHGKTRTAFQHHCVSRLDAPRQ